MLRTICLLLLASLAMAADQRPLVLSTANGYPAQIPAGSRLSLPTAAGGFYVTLDPGVQTATRVFTLPVTAAGDTFDVLGTAQTFTATKTISTTAAQLILDATSGAVNLNFNLAGASKFTLACPSASIPFGAFDQVNSWYPIQYNAGAVSAGFVTFNGTKSASSATAGSVLIGNGTAATNVAIGGGNINAGGIITASASSGNGTLAVSSTNPGTSTTTGSVINQGGYAASRSSFFRGVAASGDANAIAATFFANQTVDPAAFKFGLDFQLQNSGATAGNSSETVGVQGNVNFTAANTYGTLAGLAAITQASAGTITNAYGVHVRSTALAGSTTTNAVGLQVDNITGATNNFAIRTNSGLVSIGDTTSASSSTTGAVVIGNGTSTSSVAIGSGRVMAGGNNHSFGDATHTSLTFQTLFANGSVQFMQNGTTNYWDTNIRPNSGKSAFLSFSENGIADRWSIGIVGGDGTLHFSNSRVATTGTLSDKLALSSAGSLTIGTTTGNNLLVSSTDDATAIGTASASFSGGVTFAKTVGLGAVSAPGSPFMGQIWNDSGRQQLMAFMGASTANGIKQCLPGVVGTAYGITGPTNTLTETSILTTGTATGTFTLPANFFKVGKMLRLTIRGTIGHLASSTINTKFKIGAVLANTTTSPTLTPSGSVDNYEVSILATCTAVGASGHIDNCGWMSVDGNGSQTRNVLAMPFATATIDTTASQALDVTQTWGAASASDYFTSGQAVLEALN